MFSPIYKPICFQVLALLFLVMGIVGEGYGQRVYANNYGTEEKSVGLSTGVVINPEYAVSPNSLNGHSAKLKISGLLGTPSAKLQLKFFNNEENLPANTSIYVRLKGELGRGVLNLGLLLASKGLVSAQKNAVWGGTQANPGEKRISGESIDILLTDSDLEIIDVDYLKITPKACFNAITLTIQTTGLLGGVISDASLEVYNAYYEFPEIQVEPVNPICSGETVTLEIKDPLSTECDQKYLWYEQETGGASIFSGIQFATPPLNTGKTYWVEYTGVDNSNSDRKSVTVNVRPKPQAPVLNINPNSQY